MAGWMDIRTDGHTDSQKGDFVDICTANLDLIDILQLISTK